MKVPEILIVSPIYIHENYVNIERTKEQFDENSFNVCRNLASYYEAIASEYHCMFMNAAKYAQASPIDELHMDHENHEKLAKGIYQMLVKC